MEKGWKRRLRHPGIFFKILILFEIILLVTVAATSSLYYKKVHGKNAGKGNPSGRDEPGEADGFCQR